MSLNLNELINRRLSRRDMLKRTAFITAGAILPLEFFSRPLFTGRAKKSAFKSQLFTPIIPSSEDRLILPEGFEYTIIRKWGDKINGSEYYGYNNDFVAYLPIEYGTGIPDDGLLAVNHEYPLPLFVSGYSDEDLKNKKLKTAEQINAERKCVGMSVFRVKKINGKWEFTEDNNYNRRYDADTPMLLTGPAAGSPAVKNAGTVRGTLANCSGGVTPWGTVLSGEENYQDYAPKDSDWSYRWDDSGEEFIEEHYGWVVEIDPYDKSFQPRKHTALGRFHHENVGITISPGGKAVCYMGDDKVNECVYKFISAKSYNAGAREANFNLLDEGNLYAADFENNKWQLLDISRPELKEKFASQADVLVNCEKASKLVGGTECNRPEDLEISPIDNSVYVSFTNNSRKQDYFGSIVRIIEKGNNPESLEFEWEVFAMGGTASGFSCPDNLTFDNEGNLWTMCDISTEKLNKDRYAPFKNNAMFMIPTQGEHKGKAFQFASGPVECEMCGGAFTPDYSTMFLSIQHPGENSASLDNPTSRWPNGGDDIPRPAVVAITGFR
jgi:secreted PhoX family phosphatase